MAEHVYLGALLAVAVYLFWSRRLRSDVTGVLVMLALIVPWPHPDGGWRGVLTPSQGFAGFGSTALVLIATMFVIGAAIIHTGAAEILGARILRRAAGVEWRLQLAVLGLATAASMFINDTTVVLIFLPLIVRVCRDRGLPPSRYLIFAAYGSLLGGQWTLIGTRSNIILSDLLRQETGNGIPFFAFAWLGAPIFALGAIFLLLVARHFLPIKNTAFSGAELREFLTELVVPPDSKAIGQRMSASQQRVAAVALLRNGERLPARLLLEAGDVVVVRGTVEAIGELLKARDFKVREHPPLDRKALATLDLVCAEAVLPARSYYIGQRVEQIPFERNYGVSVIGIAHRGKPVETRMMEAELEGGDSLLLLGSSTDMQRLDHHSGLMMLEHRTMPALAPQKATIMLALLATIIVTSITGVLQPTVAIPLAGALALFTGCISVRAAYEAIDWPVLVLLGSIISYGTALDESGAADAIAAAAVTQLGGLPPVVMIGALLGIAVLFTQLVENAAVAIILAPIVFRAATALDLDPTPMLVALGVCVSAGFATPIAHESTILVMGPGGYRFSHYLIAGGALAILTWAVATALTPIVFGTLS